MEFINENLETRRQSGIYIIQCLIDGKFYIGSAKNFGRRYNQHCWMLRLNNHHSKHLQHAYNKYGKDNFVFEIVQNITFDQDKIVQLEQEFLDKFQSWRQSIGYNLSTYADYRCNSKGRVQSEESNKKRSESLKKITRKDNTTIEATKNRSDAAVNHRGTYFEIVSPANITYKRRGLLPFCKEFDLDFCSMKMVIRGQFQHHMGWHLPNKELDYRQFIDPNGKLIKILRGGRFSFLKKFCQENNLNHHSMMFLWNHKLKFNCGYTRYDVIEYHYRVISPNGEIFIVCKGMFSDFCSRHGLRRTFFPPLIQGRYKQMKGWRLEKLFKSQEEVLALTPIVINEQ